ncbi:hypothetical protein [Sphingomonas mollis]|nr:hypothetical protein [Sphingomonas sp. BT553]
MPDMIAVVHRRETFQPSPHYSGQDQPFVIRWIMKQILPVFLALIPLAAVIGACVTCP